MKTENISKEDFIVCADNILDDCEKLSWTDPENAETDINQVKKEWRVHSKKHRKSRPYLKRQKTMDVWSNCLPIVSYMTRQMDEAKPYKYGSFDFAYFNDIRYCKYPDDFPGDEDNYDNILEF